jgi:MFS family permease
MSAPQQHERVALALLRLYPEAFRTRFGPELVQLTGDMLRDARAGREGSSGLTVTWLRILVDIVRTAPSEHLEQRRVAHSLSRPASTATKIMGLLGIVGGTFLVAALLPDFPWNWVTFNLRLVPFEAGAIAIVIAIHALQAARRRWPSLIVAVPAILANAWHLVMTIMFVTRPQPPLPDPEFRPSYALAAMSMWFANAAFGIVALRLGAVSRWGSLALILGSLLAVSGFSALGLTQSPLAGYLPAMSMIGVILVGAAWILLGIAVATRRRPLQKPAAPVSPQDA